MPAILSHPSCLGNVCFNKLAQMGLKLGTSGCPSVNLFTSALKHFEGVFPDLVGDGSVETAMDIEQSLLELIVFLSRLENDLSH